MKFSACLRTQASTTINPEACSTKCESPVGKLYINSNTPNSRSRAYRLAVVSSFLLVFALFLSACQSGAQKKIAPPEEQPKTEYNSHLINWDSLELTPKEKNDFAPLYSRTDEKKSQPFSNHNRGQTNSELEQNPSGASPARFLDHSKIYFGGLSKKSQRVACVNFYEVSQYISAYQKIQQLRIGPSNAEFHVLAGEGSKVFYLLVAKLAKELEFDIVVEESCISGHEPTQVPNLSSQLIQLLLSNKKN